MHKTILITGGAGFIGSNFIRYLLSNQKLNIIKDIPGSLTRNKYLEIEDKFKDFAEKIKIPMDHLDLLFWSMETGEIFK